MTDLERRNRFIAVFVIFLNLTVVTIFLTAIMTYKLFNFIDTHHYHLTFDEWLIYFPEMITPYIQDIQTSVIALVFCSFMTCVFLIAFKRIKIVKEVLK